MKIFSVFSQESFEKLRRNSYNSFDTHFNQLFSDVTARLERYFFTVPVLTEQIIVLLRCHFGDTYSTTRSILAKTNLILNDIRIDSDVAKTS